MLAITVRSSQTFVNSLTVRRYHHLFNQQLREIASKPKDFLGHAFKGRWPLLGKEKLSRELDLVKNQCERRWQGKWEAHIGEAQQEFFDHSATNCVFTSHAVRQIATNYLFKTQPHLLSKTNLENLSSEENLTREMMKNELKLYHFLIMKGTFGHAFTVIQYPTQSDSLFYLYQSYLDHYNLLQYMSGEEFRPYDLSQLKAKVLTPLLNMKEDWSEENYRDYQKLALASMESHEQKHLFFPGKCKIVWESFKNS